MQESQRLRQAGVYLQVVRLESPRRLIMFDRLVRVTRLSQRHRKFVLGFDEFGVNSHRTFIMGDRVFDVTFAGQDVGQIAVGVRIVWIDRNGYSELLASLAKLACTR